jgi:hypothetical protein
MLACFKHRSPPNVSMYEFLDIETAAHYYDLSMIAAMRAREDYGITIAELGYDQFWANPEAETRRVLEFVDLPWDDALLAPDGTLLGDAKKSPSVWRHYESHLAPVMPILQKWVDYFGYE